MDLEYMRDIRRKLHKKPEVGFDLDGTAAIVKGELDKMGVKYTEGYCKSSVVGYIGPEDAVHTIALRADMDALPIFEKKVTEYSSENNGKMHACGHDAHTAMLLGAALKILRRKEELKNRVMLVFQPSEEGMASGAEIMVKNRLMDEIDFILAQHVENRIQTGEMSVGEGAAFASNNVFEIVTKGRSAHASQPEKGIDAVGMAVDCYARIRKMIENEVNKNEKQVLNVGIFNGGTAVNSIPCEAKMTCTLRTYNDKTAKFIMDRIEGIAKEAALFWGGEAEVIRIKELPCVMNHPEYVKRVKDIAKGVFKKVYDEEGRMASEDFAFYQTKKPGVIYMIGSGSSAKGIDKPHHSDEFDIDEDALEYGAEMMAEAVFEIIIN